MCKINSKKKMVCCVLIIVIVLCCIIFCNLSYKVDIRECKQAEVTCLINNELKTVPLNAEDSQIIINLLESNNLQKDMGLSCPYDGNSYISLYGDGKTKIQIIPVLDDCHNVIIKSSDKYLGYIGLSSNDFSNVMQIIKSAMYSIT